MKYQNTNNVYGDRAGDPFFWLAQAKELDSAAMVIWTVMRKNLVKMSEFEVGTVVRCVNLGGVFWLNAGLAIENLLKGIIVNDRPDLVVDGRIGRKLRTHNLMRLARLASIELDPIEGYFLWVGTECVTWAGRYPCSTTPGQTKPPVFSEADVLGYRRLFDRFVGHFDDSDSRCIVFERVI